MDEVATGCVCSDNACVLYIEEKQCPEIPTIIVWNTTLIVNVNFQESGPAFQECTVNVPALFQAVSS